MAEPNIPRQDLDNQEFLKLRRATGKIAAELESRLKRHLTTLRPLFIPRKLLGTYVKSSSQQEIHGSEKAFAELQEMYSGICDNPFQLPKKLQPPLTAISGVLECTPLEYSLEIENSTGNSVTITSPTKFLLSYQSECPLKRLLNMLQKKEARQPEEMRQALLCHMALVVFLKNFPVLSSLLEDLRYRVEIIKLERFGNLPVVLITAPLDTFLPNDDFVQEVTQLSGIPAFQEIIDLDAVENFPDTMKDTLNALVNS
jgi:hypothetical protein